MLKRNYIIIIRVNGYYHAHFNEDWSMVGSNSCGRVLMTVCEYVLFV